LNDPMLYAAIAVMAVIFLLCVRNVLRKKKGNVRVRDPMDKPIWSAGGVTLLTERTLCQGVLVTGQTGSGKSSGVIHNLLKAIMRAGYGCCLIAPKPGDCDDYLRIAKQCGREDTVVLNRGGKHKLSLFDTLLRVDESPATLAQLGQASLEVLSEVISRKDGHSGEDATFWQGSFQNHGRCFIGVFCLASVMPTPKRLMKLQNSVPRSVKELNSPEFKDSFCARLLERARSNAKGRWEEDFETYYDYLTSTLPRLGEKTRSVVEMMMSNCLSPLLSGAGADVLASTPTFDLGELVSNNGILICDFPLAQFQQVGQAIGASCKYLVQLEIMRRNGGKPFVIVVDESAQYLSSFDSEYVSVSRSFKGPMVICLQGVEQLARGDDNTKMDILSGNLATKLFCLPTPRTADFASKLIGRHRDFFVGGSTQSGGYEGPFDYGSSNATGSFNEQLTEIIRPEELYTLRTGGAVNDNLVDALLIQSGKGHEFITLKQG
jgi:hypothetical protein